MGEKIKINNKIKKSNNSPSGTNKYWYEKPKGIVFIGVAITLISSIIVVFFNYYSPLKKTKIYHNNHPVALSVSGDETIFDSCEIDGSVIIEKEAQKIYSYILK